MPLYIAKWFHKATLLPPIEGKGANGMLGFNNNSSVVDNTTRAYVRIVSVIILCLVFLSALAVAVYNYFILHSTMLPTGVTYILATGITYAVNSLGLQSGVAITQNSVPQNVTFTGTGASGEKSSVSITKEVEHNG